LEGVILIETNTLAVFARELLQVTFDCGGTGAFADGSGLLIVLTLANFGENTGFFARTLEAAQCYVKGLVFLDLDMGH
jgi:hypothetical protein